MKFIIDENGKLKRVKGVSKNDTKIVIPNGVATIGNSALFACRFVREIELPDTVETIEKYAFQECSRLKKITIPESVKVIEEFAFWDCRSLEEIKLPDTIVLIKDGAFNNCKKIKEIVIPRLVNTIYPYTFEGCSNLENIKLPKSVKYIKTFSFNGCESIKNISLGNYMNLLNPSVGKLLEKIGYFYVNRETGELIASKEELDLDNFKKIEYMDNKIYLNCDKQIAVISSIVFDKTQIKQMKVIKSILPRIISDVIAMEDYDKVVADLGNNKEFSLFIKRLVKDKKLKNTTYYDLFKLAYSLGAFSSNQVDRQRACEFLSNAFDKKIFDFYSLHGSFESLKFSKFNKEWAEFIMNKQNLQKLVVLEKEQSGYMARICNNFEDIKEYGRSNRGDQHYRKVTIDMCKEYCSKVSFTGISTSSIDIIETIRHYTRNQESFDNAKSIREKYLILRSQGKIKDHILEMELKEIEDLRENILDDVKETLENLGDVSNEKFTYEFLSKYDSRNFILGKYCSCCSHLEGVGKGIMEASILHPDCQNLVIKNSEGKIIAKSTLYINREQGYGVFNNVEINNNIRDEKTKKIIYEKYTEAIDKFAKEYNKRNPSRKLNQINVGMSLNDLSAQIRSKNEKSSEVLMGIDFSTYEGYPGDWQKEQFIVWQKENVEKR